MTPRNARPQSAADMGSDWEQEMARWMAPFLTALGHKCLPKSGTEST
jgi:hypothetical protein